MYIKQGESNRLVDISEKIDNTVDDDTCGNKDESLNFILFYLFWKKFQLIPKTGIPVRERWIE